MTGGPDERMTERLDDKMIGWQDDGMNEWLDDWMNEWLDDWMTYWPDDQMTGWLEALQPIDRIVYLCYVMVMFDQTLLVRQKLLKDSIKHAM